VLAETGNIEEAEGSEAETVEETAKGDVTTGLSAVPFPEETVELDVSVEFEGSVARRDQVQMQPVAALSALWIKLVSGRPAIV